MTSIPAEPGPVGEAARLDVELVRRGLARSREIAVELIRDGGVRVDGEPARKPAQPVTAADTLTVADRPDAHYVSRGALKLRGALAAWPAVDPAGRRCLDAGASTGGFTQLLLERGAREVVAVDVGHGQLDSSVAADPRVRCFEGLHLRDLDLTAIGGPADLVVADLSFISLRQVIGVLAGATAPDGDLIPMVKPQFEVGRERLGRGGVVRSWEVRREAVAGVVSAARGAGFALAGLVASPLPGPAGNVEFFVWLRRRVVTPVELDRAWSGIAP